MEDGIDLDNKIWRSLIRNICENTRRVYTLEVPVNTIHLKYDDLNFSISYYTPKSKRHSLFVDGNWHIKTTDEEVHLIGQYHVFAKCVFAIDASQGYIPFTYEKSNFN